LALHSVIVSACAEFCIASTVANAAATNKNLRVVIGVFLTERLSKVIGIAGDPKIRIAAEVDDVHPHPVTRYD
jgi:hypothetical protein